MTTIDMLMRKLARRQPSRATRYGRPAALIGAMTLLRFVAPLDVAPFLLYMPVLFVLTIALGWEAGVIAAITSTAAAARFFVHNDLTRSLSPGEIIALVQYVIVDAVMVLIYDALRRSIVKNEITLAQLGEANRTLMQNEAELRTANDRAEAARLDAEGAKNAAEQANLVKSAFIANMSHELRTPNAAYRDHRLQRDDDRGDRGRRRGGRLCRGHAQN